MRSVSKGSAFILRWFAAATSSLSSTNRSILPPSVGCGIHSFTEDSMPLVARMQDVGWLWRQLTIESSPMRILAMLVDSLSQMKNLGDIHIGRPHLGGGRVVGQNV